MPSVLIADDEPLISSFVAKGLTASGFTVRTVGDGESALAAVDGGGIDLLILDIGLPGIDGYEVLRRLRGAGHELPVIMLTARNTVRDTVAGFEHGADDYLTKPFRFDELLVRVRARLRRPVAATPTSMRIAAAGIELDLRTRRALVDGRIIELSGREFALLEQFLRSPDRVLSRQQLLSTVWELDFDPGSNVVDAYVRSLRKKIGVHRIATVRGAGYRLAA